MADIFKAELAEASRRRSGGDLNAILHALDADGFLNVVDDPAPEKVTDEETGEETEIPYAVGPELAIEVAADEEEAEKAEKEAAAEAKKAEAEAKKAEAK